MRRTVQILWLATIWSCAPHQDFVLDDKKLIPEGTAFNTQTHTIYIGSIYRQKVIAIDANGEVYDIIAQDQFGKFSPLGMAVTKQNDMLWVAAAVAPIVRHAPGTQSETALFAFDLGTNQTSKKYVLDTDQPAMFNDLTLDHFGNVYATETLGSQIYWVNQKTNQLELFRELNDFHHPNGIAFHQPTNCLFVATDAGIVKLALESKAITLLEAKNGIDTTVIDGLAIHQDYFIGHQSTKVSKFYFDDEVSSITHVEILDSGKAFDSSTTGEVGNGYYHYIVNSQIRSGVDRPSKTIKPLNSLEHVIIRKRKL